MTPFHARLVELRDDHDGLRLEYVARRYARFCLYLVAVYGPGVTWPVRVN